MIRKIFFWIHLACGVLAALVILMMSVTAVLLTYERQMVAWANSSLDVSIPPGATRHTIEDIIAAAGASRPGKKVSSVTLASAPASPARVSFGRDGTLYIDPYTLTPLGEGAVGMQKFFSLMTSWHRWFNAEGEWFDTARAITGASNLIFLFLILSGLYLWLPKIYRWTAFRAVLLFSRRALRNSKARDYNWHHVLGFWCAIPLAIVVATATVFYYPWANNLVYRVVGEVPPNRNAPPKPQTPPATSLPLAAVPTESTATPRTLEQLYLQAARQLPEWNRISLQIPNDNTAPVRFSIDQGNGGQPQKRHTLKLARDTGAIVSWEPFSSQSLGQRLRSYIRFLHTGEALGIAGQTIAGIVSLASILMVWTGVALSYRRLIRPLYRSIRS